MARMRSCWLASFADVPDPACELVCFPYAGGSGSVFRGWQRHTRSLRVTAACLPGREVRLSEPAIPDIDRLTTALLTAVTPLTGRRYAFFGHSMGALVAFELTRRIRDAGLPLPAGLFVAGMEAPHLVRFDPAHDLPRDELVAWLHQGQGLDAEVLAYPELIDLMLPTIRADLAVAENYRFRPLPPLPVPVHVLHGRDDDVDVAASGAWAELTSEECRVTTFDGGHFFVREHEGRIVRLIEDALTTTTPARETGDIGGIER
ncbi:alpha/beta fold hydrolase [Microbispora amethystogenes]|uniref:thioesterase II family protein n=1 Tax=Microbispora amethystogenes TaxID=1427754 RepID=UPI0033D9D94A